MRDDGRENGVILNFLRYSSQGRGPYVGPPPGPPLPRPVPARDRSFFRQVVDGLLGEGPGSNYALICRDCQSHNGLAMKEEFEYLGMLKIRSSVRLNIPFQSGVLSWKL